MLSAVRWELSSNETFFYACAVKELAAEFSACLYLTTERISIVESHPRVGTSISPQVPPSQYIGANPPYLFLQTVFTHETDFMRQGLNSSRDKSSILWTRCTTHRISGFCFFSYKNYIIKRRKGDRICHMLHRNCLLKRLVEREVEGRGTRGRRRK